MSMNMKCIRYSFFAAFVAMTSLQSRGQIVFCSADLLAQTGAYHRAYYTTSTVDVSTLLGQPGGPRRWDFSYAKMPNESAWRPKN